jgi:hypothetical protein
MRAARRVLLPKRVREWITSRYFRVESKPKLPPHVADRLKAVFDKDLEKLSDWMGFPITCDTWQEVADTREPVFRVGDPLGFPEEIISGLQSRPSTIWGVATRPSG